MSRLYDAVRSVAQAEAQRVRTCELAIVKLTHSSPDGSACDVELRDSGLVLPHVPIAVGVRGFAALPRVGELVAVLFVGGDVNAPLVVGRLYDDGDLQPDHADDQIVLRLPAGTQSDGKIDLVVEAGDNVDGSITLSVDAGRTRIEIRGGEVRAAVGSAELALLDVGDDTSAEVKVGSSRLHVSATGDVTLEASNKLVLKGAQVEVQGDIGVKINGTTVELN